MTDAIKKPIPGALNELAVQRAKDAVQRQGMSLPCHVVRVVSSAVVTVAFDVNAAPFTLNEQTIPVLGSPYILYPITEGDKGVAWAASTKLGGQSGLGTGTPDLTPPGNLSGLAFEWLGSTDYPASLDPTALELFGNILCKPGSLGFYGKTGVSKPTISGALSSVTDSNAKAVLASIIEALEQLGLVTDGTS